MWDAFRVSAEFAPLADTFGRMAGARQRCAYCSDSHAADVDHFKPIKNDYGSTFQWKNLLWVCPMCNRRKSTRFPVAPDGGALLIDPCVVDPWKHFTLDTLTGFVAPRYIDDHYDIFGEATLDVLPTINYEAVVEGRVRVCRRIISAIRAVNADPTFDAVHTLVREISNDDVGVSRWYGYWDGAREPEMMLLKQTRETIWKRFLRACV